MLYEYCQEIQQQELTLQDMQARIMPRQSLPLYHLCPTIELLRKIRKILKRQFTSMKGTHTGKCGINCRSNSHSLAPQ